jgi:hypothetical protein
MQGRDRQEYSVRAGNVRQGIHTQDCARDRETEEVFGGSLNRFRSARHVQEALAAICPADDGFCG